MGYLTHRPLCTKAQVSESPELPRPGAQPPKPPPSPIIIIAGGLAWPDEPRARARARLRVQPRPDGWGNSSSSQSPPPNPLLVSGSESLPKSARLHHVKLLRKVRQGRHQDQSTATSIHIPSPPRCPPHPIRAPSLTTTSECAPKDQVHRAHPRRDPFRRSRHWRGHPRAAVPPARLDMDRRLQEPHHRPPHDPRGLS